MRKVSRAPFLLVTKLYYHRLFPLWPRLNSKRLANALKPIRSNHSQPHLQHVASLFEYLRWLDVYAPRAAGDLPDRVRFSVAPNLDPALISDASARFIDTNSRT